MKNITFLNEIFYVYVILKPLASIDMLRPSKCAKGAILLMLRSATYH